MVYVNRFLFFCSHHFFCSILTKACAFLKKQTIVYDCQIYVARLVVKGFDTRIKQYVETLETIESYSGDVSLGLVDLLIYIRLGRIIIITTCDMVIECPDFIE